MALALCVRSSNTALWIKAIPRKPNGYYRPLLLVILLVGFGFSLPLLNQFPFREDEAIYSFWALHFWQDPFFLTVWPDKPPIYLGALALAYQLFGASEASARWLNICFASATTAIVIATARHQWGERAALFSGVTMALSPFGLSFAPTAYTDPLLVLTGSAALYAALTRRCYWSGFWLGLAIMTKQQGLFYLPLVVAVLAASRWPRQRLRWAIFLFVSGLATIIAPIVYWDSLRWAVAPSPWDLGVKNYGALVLLPISQWAERLAEWTALAWYLLANSWGWLFVSVLLLYQAAKTVMKRPLFQVPPRHRSLSCTAGDNEQKDDHAQTSAAQRRPALFGAILLLWVIGFATLHVITNLQVWDRYLLPLVPVCALLWGAALASVAQKMQSALKWGISALWILLLVQPALSAAGGALPIGADHGDYAGLPQALNWLEQEMASDFLATRPEAEPTGFILYHHLLGWHYRFYLHEELQRRQIDLRWFPSALYLAQDATKAPHRRKFVIIPSWAPVRDLERFTGMHDINLIRRVRFAKMTVVELAPEPGQFCDWCYCRGWPEEGFATKKHYQ